MEAVLARIDAVNPEVNAIVTLVRDAALWEARRATAALKRGAPLPPLFGVPVGIKDVTLDEGHSHDPWLEALRDHVPDEDALVVQRLRAAGAIVIGKTNTPEFAFGPNTVNAVFGATRNPWNLALTAGGSSGGSAAALATGMCPLAEGTDLGGSLRGPGVVLRRGRVPHDAGADPALPVGARVGHVLGGRADGAHRRRRRAHARR